MNQNENTYIAHMVDPYARSIADKSVIAWFIVREADGTTLTEGCKTWTEARECARHLGVRTPGHPRYTGNARLKLPPFAEVPLQGQPAEMYKALADSIQTAGVRDARLELFPGSQARFGNQCVRLLFAYLRALQRSQEALEDRRYSEATRWRVDALHGRDTWPPFMLLQAKT